MQDKYVILKYLRLSHEDGDDFESDSIANQRNLLDFHIGREFSDRPIEIMELVDDGYSGTNMNRPGMKKLLVLAETHSVDCIIVKDFSRFARDYIEVGRFVEQKFPEWEIRFISVNDRYDSHDYRGITGGIDVALKNIVYTMYSIDLSEKVKSARRVQYKMGKFISPYAFYGYKKNPDNKTQLIIDEPAAEVVRKIFNMRLSGFKSSYIAQQLNKEGVLTPAEYKKSIDPLCREWNCVSGYHHWTGGIVLKILHDERYTGKLISGKHERISVGSSKVRSVKKEDIIVVENTHEPIISKEVFDAVQAVSQKRINVNPAKFGLRGLVRCGGCRHKMSAYGKTNLQYTCSYKNLTEHNNCFCGKVSERELVDIVSETIRAEVIKTANMSAVEKKIDSKVRHMAETVEMLNCKISEQKRKKTEEYILLTKEQITEDEFERRRDEINNAIAVYEKQIEKLRSEEMSSEKLTAAGIFEKYIGIDEINRETVEDLIKAIYVYPDKRIEIVWKFREKEY